MGDNIEKYCKHIVDDFVLFAKVREFKKRTLASFAFGGCDSPLCDQLIFLHEWIALRQPEWIDTHEGEWRFDQEAAHTKVDTSSRRGPQGCQPSLKDPNDETKLNVQRDKLQEYVMRHLHRLK